MPTSLNLRDRLNDLPRWASLLLRSTAAVFVAVVVAAGFVWFQADRLERDMRTVEGSLLAAQKHLGDGDEAAAVEAVDRAQKAVGRARGRSDGVLAAVGRLPVAGTQTDAVAGLVSVAERIVAAAHEITRASAAAPLLADDHAAVNATNLRLIVEGLKPAAPALERADRLLARAEAELGRLPRSGLLGSLRGARVDVGQRLDEARHQTAVARDLMQLGDYLVTPGRSTRLLLLAQDTWELRPTGGYIGSYGIVQIDSEGIHLVRYDDATALPEQAAPYLYPPEPFRSAMNRPWRLTGAGWWPNFPESAAAAQQVFRRQGGEPVDGVLAITQQLLEDLVRAFGSVEVPGYPETLTADNIAERILYHVELKKPLEVPRKRFLTLLTETMFDRLEHVSGEQAPVVLDALGRAARARHLQLFFNNPQLHKGVAAAGWDGAMRPPESGDFFAFADANFGTDKANRWVTRTVQYGVELRDGEPWASVRIATHHVGPRSPINNLYHSYFRVFAPPGSVLGGDRVERFLTRVDAESGFVTFGHDQVVDVDATEVRTMTYRLPASVFDGDRYRLTVRPQPGTPADTYEVVLRLGGRPVTHRFTGDAGDQHLEASM